jgi:alpha-tubulin suppressor-like RCC1 family protein
MSTNGVQCWGANTYGQLGDGTTGSRGLPASVIALAPDITGIASGGFPNCALRSTNGAVQCWGSNWAGQIGDGTTVGSRALPTDVTGLSSAIKAVAVGFYHTCALTTTGGVQCWGYNNNGQVGDGTTTDRAVPTNVVGMASGVAAITAGGYHTCALLLTGGVQCWGDDPDRPVPTNVTGLGSVATAIAVGGSHSCAVLTAGGVQCWGINNLGQLGDGTVSDFNSASTFLAPVSVSGLTARAVAIAAGNSHTCALLSDGGVQCWGMNSYGQLGDGNTTDVHGAAVRPGLASTATAVTTGSAHTCALLSTGGGMQCWGYNEYGQLGDGVTSFIQLAPTSVKFS